MASSVRNWHKRVYNRKWCAFLGVEVFARNNGFFFDELIAFDNFDWGCCLAQRDTDKLAYVLYNHSLQTLTALEMNVMLNLTPLGTALLAWWLLGEKLGFVQIIGMVIMIVGVVFVQRMSKTA